MKITKRSFLTSLIGTPALLSSAPAEAIPSDEEFGKNLFKFISRENLIDHIFDSIITESINPLLRVLPWKSLNLNQAYDNNSLNIFVIDAKFKSHSIADVPYYTQTVLQSRDNFIAIPPNTILADKLTIAKILHAAMEYMSGNYFLKSIRLLASGSAEDVMKGNPPSDLTPSEVPRWLSTLNALITRRLMRIYSDFLTTQDNCDLLAHKLADDYELQRQAPKELRIPALRMQTYRATLAPLIFHEFAHLTHRDLGGFLDTLKGWAKAVFGPTTREREDAADDQAMRLLREYIADEAFDSASIATMGIRAFINYLDARIWTVAFSGLRGMEARDLFWQFEYVPCDQWDLWFAGLRARRKLVA